MKQGIAFFDFDGTITTKDTLIEFIRYNKGSLSLFFGFFLHLHYLVGYKLKFISNQTAKEKILAHYFGGTEKDQFEQLCKNFAENKLPQLIRTKAVEEIKKLQQQSVETVIVSASPENWVAFFADKLNMQLIATKLETSDNRITGKINGYNCYGKEKVNRINLAYRLDDYEKIYAYGDSSGDKQMLAIAHYSYMKPFHK
ncbi:MAG: HAD-IB family hydrolase [Lacibacter sp.]